MKAVWQILGIVIFLASAHSLPSRSGKAADKEESKWKTLDGKRTVLLAHRGEKVLLPEHTIPAYETASLLGADFVEPDLCLTKDNHFVCHHDPTLASGTDVSKKPEFADRKRPELNDWIIRDFTLEELKTLRVIQDDKGVRPQVFNGLFTIPTFDEYLDTIHSMSFKLNRTIGVIPEIKLPSMHNADQGEANFMEKLVLESLKSRGYRVKAEDKESCKAIAKGQEHNIPCPPLIIQSFEKPSLDFLATQTIIDLCMLVASGDYLLLTFKGVEDVAKIAKYFSPYKEYVYTGVEAQLTYEKVNWNKTAVEALGGFIPAKEFPEEAHKHGMKLVVWTVNDSHEPSNTGCAGPNGCETKNKTKELDYYFGLGVDGVFVENVAESREILQEFKFQLEHSGNGAPSMREGLLVLLLSLGIIFLRWN